ncbi:phospho-2-dehydro-3-deoxyheptonate aldolase [Thermanaerovibrio acidaminovorans DSM 6589]|uniref:Phospho-2-dehydro-3-deoxyheptonate aldolase n=1 Tax=Thermanaerovibrio acidaminovorans (strain ATCC 49978 / DSM 6589 / Su883) TaxID=525903 RepID=D1B762_THEAS|nr:3-deoxy-7-phosphoheptulonate synthase [Thermanaerovibrio acidaminovorans]ACZ19853.1 phospho-2-dehydro-3-deoxyheptonate aldolase [Thermanaerovibrio acidaminovorans DSM 6589]
MMTVLEVDLGLGGRGLADLMDRLAEMGREARLVSLEGVRYVVVHGRVSASDLSGLPVRWVRSTGASYPLVSREAGVCGPVRVGSVEVGGGDLVVMAGPCSVEGRDQIVCTALGVKEAGASILRGGAFKPRTNPYSFQGLGGIGVGLLKEASRVSGLPVVTEVMSPEDVEWMSEEADLLQVGARNMQNFPLLREVGRSHRPVLLKRGMMATVDEWLQAAEYVVSSGNPGVILCERGIRSFDRATRNLLDLSAVPLVKRLSGLPVVVDPSHGTGRRDMVIPMSLAAVAAGADGLIVEVHPSPKDALCDGDQSLDLDEFRDLMGALGALTGALNGRWEVPSWERVAMLA